MVTAERIESRAVQRRWRPQLRLGVVVLIIGVACAMATTVVLYARGAQTRFIPTYGASTATGTTVELDVQRIQDNYNELVGDLIVSPGPPLLDPVTNSLKQDLTVVVTSTTTPVRRSWSTGMSPGTFPVPLTLARDVEQWLFDHYFAGPITVELFTGGSQHPERANVTFVDRLPGWNVHVGRVGAAGTSAPYEVEIQRATSTMVFAIVVLCILIAIAVAGLFVAVQTLRGLRKFQSPMTTWYAAMLFAVVPLRNALPGSPAFGSWVDLTIVLWVLVALVVAMLLYIAAWWRHLKPTDVRVDIPG